MPTVTDGSAINYCNTQTRPFCDALAQAYYKAKNALATWTAQNLGGTTLPAGSGQVEDGSPADGRPAITGDEAYGISEQMTAFVAYMEANNSAVLNAVLAVAVNTLPRV